MAEKSTNNIELKILVDKGSNKVIFIEPDNDFVDILFSFMTIPMGTIIRLARKHSDPVVIGCMNNLYASVENIDEQKFWIDICKDMLLHPRNAADSHCNDLNLKLDDTEPRRYFMCPNLCKVLSYYRTYCPCSCLLIMNMEKNLSLRISEDGSVFVKGQTSFTVTDDLQVIPPNSSANSVFTKLGLMDVNATEELTINVGTFEILNLLMCSLVSKTPLTETLLKPKQDLKSRSTILNQAMHSESHMSGDSMNDEEDKISLNLVVSKSKKIVCYAEAGEDFVNLLFSFLTLPLGFIVKNLKNSSMKGCIRHLYNTIHDLDGQYMISDHHKEMLLDPKLVPGFCYYNSLLGIEETSYYYVGRSLTTDRSLCSSESDKLKVVGFCSMDLNAQGFLKRPAMFVVTDNLVVRPMSRIFELQVLTDLNVHVTDIEDQIVHVGKKESMAYKSTNNIELKVLVDKESNKVIFIEPDNDFVDVLFSFMTIPMGTIIRLARKHSDPVAIGCMNNLYASVENIDEQKFWIPICKDMLLHPRNAAAPQCNLLKLKLYDAEPRRCFLCSTRSCISYDQNNRCPCWPTMCEMSPWLRPSQVGSVFVKGEMRFTVTDDLQVIPPIASTNSVFTKLGVMDVDATEELTVNIGNVEMFNLLMSSLVSKTPLTETLLKPKQDPKLSSKVINQAIHFESQMFGDSTNDEEGKISVKLVVSKSKKMVCYAEAGEDFISLLFSFLTVPLGFILKNLKDGSLRGCISHLYKTIQDLDGQYMISNHHNEMILDPKLIPGFCHKNSLLGIEETSYYYGNGNDMLTTDRSLFSWKPNQLRVIGEMDVSALGFLKGPAMFVVTDNLVVRPISRIVELHVLKDLNVPVTDIEDQIVHVGKKEALHLLLSSFLCDSVLTNTFVGDLREPKQEQ